MDIIVTGLFSSFKNEAMYCKCFERGCKASADSEEDSGGFISCFG